MDMIAAIKCGAGFTIGAGTVFVAARLFQYYVLNRDDPWYLR